MGFPVRPVKRPNRLAGQSNGKLAAEILVDVPGQRGGPRVRLVKPAARAWTAMCAAALAAGHTLKATDLHGSYRPYEVQERIFRERYTRTVLPGQPSRMWNRQRWYQKPGTAKAAVPGTSNHGLGLAVDTGEERDHNIDTDTLDGGTLRWLIHNEQRFGFSHEIQSEPWHIRYFAGDTIPAAVTAYESEIENSHTIPTDPATGDDDDMTPQQFLTILRDPAVAATMRALPWQYTDPGHPSAHGIVLAEMRMSLRQLAATADLISAKVNIDDTELARIRGQVEAELAEFAVGEVADKQQLATRTLAGLTPAVIVDTIITALPADQAKQVATQLTAKLAVLQPQG
ncbi:D-alanyl-D-alanine carboxypeptidase-like protein [Micromonospora kangleipakensis]|uniref:D-alanyl-D-alanine carboxypeptidase-like protein n=1 Tax=Micromonospora kangleipakensis TaxID=1077942 RepID=A0A4Q8BFB7_9ACTN|nr:M15 family metallopeptidase [Micromonospora kangleipakensis]RZU76075.1 D-alanyl-D-alanine carboxypeptidase-like protein [Micromonospora kangleipakensis]